RQALIAFLRQISQDRALIMQLTADSLDLFNATSADPDSLNYGCVVTRARPPSLSVGLGNYRDAYAQALYLLFCSLWCISACSDSRYFPVLDAQQRAALIGAYGGLPKVTDNDGMSPTLSQVWGEVVHVTDADHLDV